EGGDEMDIVIDLAIDGADVRWSKLPLVIEGVRLRATISGDTVLVSEMAGGLSGGSIRVRGDVVSSGGEDGKVAADMDVECDGVEIDEEWVGFLREGGEPNELTYDATVSMAAKCNVELRGSEYKAVRTRLDCSDGTVDIKGAGYVFENISGGLVVTEEGVSFEKLNVLAKSRDADGGEYKLTIAGGVNTGVEDGYDNDVSVTVDEIALEKVAVGGMSEKVRGIYEALRPRGKVKIKFDGIKAHGDAKTGRWFGFGSLIGFDGLGLGEDGDISEATGSAAGTWRYSIDGGIIGGEGEISIGQMKLRGYQLSNLRTKYQYDSVGDSFVLKDMLADCYGGKVAGGLSCKRLESGGMGYVVQTKFDGLDIGKMFADKSEDKADEKINWQGKVFGQFGMDGEFDKPDSRIGRVKLDVKDMKFAKRSFIDKVLAVISLTNPADHMFNEITVDAYIKRNTVVFEKVRMIGDLNVFQGSGTVDLDSEKVNIELTAFGKDLTKDPSLLESLARGIGGAVVKVEVGGSLSEPKVVVTPLPVVMWPLELLGKEKAGAVVK
ncbi:MAG: AsmA-like C-terminal domain-containing protein, partial [Anaerohalosphaera sp.]|nr:AsmA-like C-terminal domain-containing protein [Anaerohalosphaera sp.]